MHIYNTGINTDIKTDIYICIHHLNSIFIITLHLTLSLLLCGLYNALGDEYIFLSFSVFHCQQPNVVNSGEKRITASSCAHTNRCELSVETDQQPCSFCDEVDRLARDFSPPAKDRSPADPQRWTLNASWSRSQPLSAFYVETRAKQNRQDVQAQGAYTKAGLNAL